MYYELLDLSFFIRSLKQPSGDSFNILSHVQFCDNKSTRSSTFRKLKHVTSPNNTHRHFYFNRLVRLWNALPPINIDQSSTPEILWDKFTNNSYPSDHCSYHFNCLAATNMIHSPHYLRPYRADQADSWQISISSIIVNYS